MSRISCHKSIKSKIERHGPKRRPQETVPREPQETISAKIEVAISYGISIPEKAEEIQTNVVQELVRMTGLHVSHIHVVFKELIPSDLPKKLALKNMPHTPPGEYSDIF